MWLIKLPIFFGKIAILKVGELVSKLALVRNKLNMKYLFMEAKFVFFTYHGPKKGSKYHAETVQTTLPENASFQE